MLTTLPPYCAVVTKSGILNLLEPSGPVQACNGTALPFTLPRLGYERIRTHAFYKTKHTRAALCKTAHSDLNAFTPNCKPMVQKNKNKKIKDMSRSVQK